MTKTIFFHAPEFFPPLDFFHGLLNSDIWVVLDHVRFISRSRQSRCRIKTDNGITLLSVTVKRPQNKPICNTIIDNNSHESQPWQHIFLKELKRYYFDMPFFGEYYPGIADFIKRPNVLLETLTLQSCLWMGEILGKKIEYARTSELRTAKRGRYTRKFPVSKVIPLLLEKTCGTIFNDPFQHPVYLQRTEPFEKNLSVLDALFCVGADNIKFLLMKQTDSSFREKLKQALSL